MEPHIDHIEITVNDIDKAKAFYDKLLPILGYDLAHSSKAVIEEHEKHVVSYEHPRFGFTITSPLNAFKDETINRRKPGALHHLAFRADSMDEVNSIYEKLQSIGVHIVSEPRHYPEYSPEHYYAFFFTDDEGIKYEIVTTKPNY